MELNTVIHCPFSSFARLKCYKDAEQMILNGIKEKNYDIVLFESLNDHHISKYDCCCGTIIVFFPELYEQIKDLKWEKISDPFCYGDDYIVNALKRLEIIRKCIENFDYSKG